MNLKSWINNKKNKQKSYIIQIWNGTKKQINFSLKLNKMRFINKKEIMKKM